MKTAVKELMEKIESYGFILHDDTKKEFLEKEKQQITDAYRHGKNIGYENADNYYKETFGDKFK